MKGRRLYLWDIDGTLLATGGAGSQAMALAFRSLWGVDDGFARIEFSGRTDRAILNDALRVNEKVSRDFDADLVRFKRAYYRRLPGTLRSNNGRVLPAVRKVLEKLTNDPDAEAGLATGNFRHSATMKLAHYGINGFFKKSLGGFGDRTELRRDLVETGLRAFGGKSRFDSVFVIGDTVHDIRSAKDNGVIAVGVTTGSADAATLSAAGADIVFATLEEAEGAIL